MLSRMESFFWWESRGAREPEDSIQGCVISTYCNSNQCTTNNITTYSCINPPKATHVSSQLGLVTMSSPPKPIPMQSQPFLVLEVATLLWQLYNWCFELWDKFEIGDGWQKIDKRKQEGDWGGCRQQWHKWMMVEWWSTIEWLFRRNEKRRKKNKVNLKKDKSLL